MFEILNFKNISFIMHLNLKKIKKQYFFRNIVYDDYDILLINENT